ncbi:MAG: hypothetical protein M1503_08105 [Thaumarchaeota archaeon]|nr:hypothetical protein [Nitrososphaerota archaeon]
MESRVAAVLLIAILVAPMSYALAPGVLAIFLTATPETQNVSAGGSAKFDISIVSKGEWVRGSVKLELLGPPKGVSATFEPNPINLTDKAEVMMTAVVAQDVPTQHILLAVRGEGTEETLQKVTNSIVAVDINVTGSKTAPSQGGATTSFVTTTTTSTTTTTVTTTLVSTTTMTVSSGVSVGTAYVIIGVTAILALVALVLESRVHGLRRRS